MAKEQFEQHAAANLQLVNALQYEFEEALGIDHDPNIEDKEKIRSYNVVLDRFNFIILQGEDEEHAIERLKAMVEWQMETNLRERYGVVSSVYRLNIKDGKLYPNYSADRPLEDIYWTGVKFRQQQGSAEWQREEGEFDGVLLEQLFFANTARPEGSKVVVVSPPGLVTNTAYPKNYIDVLELKKNSESEETYVQATRFSSKLGYEQYREKVTAIENDYFNDPLTAAMPIDAWFLSHPLFLQRQYLNLSPDTIYELWFEGDPTAMKDQEFKNVVMTLKMKQLIAHYIDTVLEEHIDWWNIAEAFDAILNFGDALVAKAKAKNEPNWATEQVEYVELLSPFDPRDLDDDSETDIEKMVHFWGMQEVKSVEAGCGSSSGYKLKNIFKLPSPLEVLLANTIGKFGINQQGELVNGNDDTEDDDDGLCHKCAQKEPHFHCPACNESIGYGKGITECPNTKCGKKKTC